MSVHHHGLLKCSLLEGELRGWLSSSRPFGKPRCTAAQRIFLKSNWSRHPSCMRAFLPFRKYMNRIKRTQIIVFMKDTYQGPLLLQVGDDRVWISRLFRILAPPCEYFYILAPPCGSLKDEDHFKKLIIMRTITALVTMMHHRWWRWWSWIK